MTHRFARVVAVIAATTGTVCLAQAAEPAQKVAAAPVKSSPAAAVSMRPSPRLVSRHAWPWRPSTPM